MEAREYNFDGLVGPTHSYAGLSHGNLASTRHKKLTSRPRDAALQGLAKMRFVSSLGVGQAILPPQHRPDLVALRALGFTGTDAQVLESAARTDPALLAACASASSMWSANAATVSPSADCADNRVHFTPANLVGLLHRSLESAQTTRTLRAIFADPSHFVVHDPLPPTSVLGDEGAANHTRFCISHGQAGLELFTFGRDALNPSDRLPTRFPARQSLQASQAVARLHQLEVSRTLYIRQNPQAIDAGAFHNDVVAVGHRNLLLYHEQAFDSDEVLRELDNRFLSAFGAPIASLMVPANRVSLEEAVASYLFNSQLVDGADGAIHLVAPTECRDCASVKAWLDEHAGAGRPIGAVHYVDVRQSMNNGGGPACLRLRVVLTGEQAKAAAPGVFVTDTLLRTLESWVQKHYREELNPDDLADPRLVVESRDALDELTGILGLGAIYPFQL
jgi:succinylarginine dihydrolase